MKILGTVNAPKKPVITQTNTDMSQCHFLNQVTLRGKRKITKFGKVPKSDRRATPRQDEQHHSHLHITIIIIYFGLRSMEGGSWRRGTNLECGGRIAGEKGSELKQRLVEVRHYDSKHPLHIFFSYSNSSMPLFLLHYSPVAIHIYSLRLLSFKPKHAKRQGQIGIHVTFTCGSRL